VSEEQFEYQSLEELADAMERQSEAPPAVEVWQDYDPSQRFIAVFPLTSTQGAAASTNDVSAHLMGLCCCPIRDEETWSDDGEGLYTQAKCSAIERRTFAWLRTLASMSNLSA
jgi:hypothetical protein